MTTEDYLGLILEQLTVIETSSETIITSQQSMYEQQTLMVYILSAVLMVLAVLIGVSIFKVFQDGIK